MCGSLDIFPQKEHNGAAVNLAYPVMMISVAISNMVGTGHDPGAACDRSDHDDGIGGAFDGSDPWGQEGGRKQVPSPSTE